MLRERLDEAHDDLTGDLVLLTVVPLLALALFLAQSHLRGLPQTAHLAPVCALAAIAFIACMLRRLLKAGTRLDHLKAGRDANVAVGQGLDQPMTQLPRTSKEPLDQAERQAAWRAKWLSSAVGSPVTVLPVVALPVAALPGWFVKRTGRGRARVFSGKELAGLLKSRGTQALTTKDVQRIAHPVEQRCRTVTPLYAQKPKAS